MSSTNSFLEIIEIAGFIVVAGSVPFVLKRFQRLNFGLRLMYDALFILFFAGLILLTIPALDRLPGIMTFVGFAAILYTFNWYVKSVSVNK